MNISIKSAISTIAIATFLSMASSAIAAPEAFKTSKGHVIVTGLKPTQRYQIRTLSAQDKPGTRQDKSANSCGEVVVEKAANYKTLVVGTLTIDPATLPTKTYDKCKPKSGSSTMQPTGVVRANTPEP
ncbi:hypothetical protein APA_3969 [Pseudanabaena sp. lw0831]|uniref:hypothetical protein n=1 Tax=Pseudanabaena sp. lw0831 TaxID=1357935 RepID=UPI001A306F75|nr:hypothetical protein [Pseudanabaena sp. lw0831]GBO55819.1 hypothetical protein APA_3969 [Pseudanabaena sp. lw0831]